MSKKRIYQAIILLDEPGGRHFATWVEFHVKNIETRMKYMIPQGEVVICCSNGSMTANKGKALCIVTVGKGRPMTTDDEKGACINAIPGRVAYPLSNWKMFSRKFPFTKYKIDGTFQAMFTIEIPEDVCIIESISV